MRVLAGLVCATVTMAAPAVAAEQQFDLVCTGTMKSVLSGSKVTHHRYRVDLATKKWCMDDCSQGAGEISKVDDVKITFQYIDEDRPSSRTFVIHDVDRRTGAWRDYWSGSISLDEKGVCETAEFSGFPVFTRKF